MILIYKLKERLENSLKILKKQTKEPSIYSYMAGRTDAINEILEWVKDLPSKDKLEEIIKAIEKNNCQSYYKYMDFDYQELLQLKQCF